MAALLPEAECVYTGPASVDAQEQAAIIRNLINTPGAVDGISMVVLDKVFAAELAQEAIDAIIVTPLTPSDCCMSVQIPLSSGNRLPKYCSS
jgi:hypothetical protein